MKGVVLCGGESRRMGADKGLMQTQGKHWAGMACQKLSTFHIPVIMSLNPLQITEYIHTFSQGKFITDSNELAVHGPLLGLLSVHRQYPNDDLFVLACDMVAIKPELLQQLMDLYITNIDKDCYLFFNGNEPEPLCGIYTAKLLRSVMQLLQTQQLKKHSMKYVIGLSDALLAPIDEKWIPCFQNFNQKEDLRNIDSTAS
jgi:molybdopterin-guanine dinucleotide biosynthesis protein A